MKRPRPASLERPQTPSSKKSRSTKVSRSKSVPVQPANSTAPSTPPPRPQELDVERRIGRSGDSTEDVDLEDVVTRTEFTDKEGDDENRLKSSSNPDETREKFIQRIVSRYDQGHRARQFKDTISQLAYEHSQDLARSLVHWDRQGGLRERRQRCRGKQDDHNSLAAPQDAGPHSIAHAKTLDPTIDSFTLWPLPPPLCPKPAWTLQEELSALVARTQRAMVNKLDDSDSGEDSESETNSNKALIEQLEKVLMKLLTNLYEFGPPSSCPKKHTKAEKKARKEQKSDQAITTELQTTSGLENSSGPGSKQEGKETVGLDWKYVMKLVSSTLNISPNVLQRTKDRLIDIYRIPPESSEDERSASMDCSSSLSKSRSESTRDVKHWRKLEESTMDSSVIE